MKGEKEGVAPASQPPLSHPFGTEPVPVSGKAGIANAGAVGEGNDTPQDHSDAAAPERTALGPALSEEADSDVSPVLGGLVHEAPRGETLAGSALLAAHTPGPWRAHDHNDMTRVGEDPSKWVGYAWVGFGGDANGAFDGMLANLDRRSDCSIPFRERAASDALLIAAAPDLLFALERARAEIVFMLGGNEKLAKSNSTVWGIDAAIAKARGQ